MGEERIALRGNLAAQLVFEGFRQNLEALKTSGWMKADDLSFHMSGSPFPVREGQIILNFSDDGIDIETVKLKTGDSQLRASGNLTGWKPWKGDIEVRSDHLNSEDIIPLFKKMILSDKERGDNQESWFQNLDIHLELDIAKGTWKRMKCGPVKSSFLFNDEGLIINDAEMVFEHGVFRFQGRMQSKEEPRYHFSSLIRLKDQPCDILLENMGMKEEYMTGLLTTESRLDGKGNNRKEMIGNMMGDAYIHIKDAQKVLRRGDSVTGIEVRVENIYKARKIAKRIDARLGLPYRAQDWMQLNQSLFQAMKTERRVMFIILTLTILVATFSIASALIMLVLGKTRDIAILKAMGATNKSIRKIFVFNGMVIGIVGTFLGLSLGLLLSTILKHYDISHLTGGIYYLINTVPVKLDVLDIIAIIAATLVICFLATLYPAHQAAKINPVDSIRYS